MAAADAGVKKTAKMVHRDKGQDSGHKVTIPCSCGGTMTWSKVLGKMRYVCDTCCIVLSR